jgi:hypothetical protein
MQYLRARYYNPASGTFNRLDPFFGNLQDPQSLHKYLYVHGDPIQGIDPTGWMSLSARLSIARISLALATIGIGVTVWLELARHMERGVAVGLGGKDITGNLYQLDRDFSIQWYALTDEDKSDIVSFGGAYSFSGWDIMQLKNLDEQKMFVPPGGVPRTVTVCKRVYYAHEVNYFLWGLLNGYAYKDRIANTSLSRTLDWVRFYRPVGAPAYAHRPHDGTITARVAWAEVGWKMAVYGILSPPIDQDLPRVTPNPTPRYGTWTMKVGPFDWFTTYDGPSQPSGSTEPSYIGPAP